jgi:hypothetical protein
MTALAAKLSALIPRLGSSFEGEVIATVRAIERTLAAAHQDWHDLARAVTPAPPAQSSGGLIDIARFCVSHADLLSDREYGFVQSMLTRLQQRDATEKQLKWLLDIRRKIEAALQG